jgi:hypothetical protein
MRADIAQVRLKRILQSYPQEKAHKSFNFPESLWVRRLAWKGFFEKSSKFFSGSSMDKL